MKTPKIEIKEYTRFSEIYALKYLVDNYYGGVLPKKTYNELEHRIKDPHIKKFFVDFFCRTDTNTSEQSSEITKKTKKKRKNKANQKKQCEMNNSSSQSSDTKIKENNPRRKRAATIITVRATDFRFQFTNVNPRLIYGDRERFFLGRAEWFNPEILRSIDRKFTIRYSGYDGFVFEPYEDMDVFGKLLEEKYGEYVTREHDRVMKECEEKVIALFEEKTSKYMRKFKHFQMLKPLEEFVYNSDRESYSVQIDCLEYLQLHQGSKYKVSIPFSSIITLFDKETITKYGEEIEEKWKKGYSSCFEISDILPGLKNSMLTLKIPTIYIERNKSFESLLLNIDYHASKGLFEGRLSWAYSSNYTTKEDAVVFSDEIKDALRRTILRVNSPFIETFYSAYVYMFNEGDKEIHEIRDVILKKYETINKWSAEYKRYSSGISSLMKFNPDESSDWVWLSDQIKKGVFEEAYCFDDKDETHSSKIGKTSKDKVKIYLTVQKNSIIEYSHSSNYWIVFPEYTISLYALDTEKSVYRFEVVGSKLYEAIFFLWSYFSSNNYNKRQDFDSVLVLKRDFGILSFYKDKPVRYKRGLGYCDNKWDAEFY